jgi:hypothetical protein
VQLKVRTILAIILLGGPLWFIPQYYYGAYISWLFICFIGKHFYDEAEKNDQECKEAMELFAKSPEGKLVMEEVRHKEEKEKQRKALIAEVKKTLIEEERNRIAESKKSTPVPWYDTTADIIAKIIIVVIIFAAIALAI